MSYIDNENIDLIRSTIEDIISRQTTSNSQSERIFLQKVSENLKTALSLGPNTFISENTAEINAIAFAHGVLYVGGNFEEAGRKQIRYLAKWDGHTWQAVGGGLDGAVYNMTVDGNHLYVVGNFQKAGNQEVSRIAQWDGFSWSPLGRGLDASSRLDVLAASNGSVFLGGPFRDVEGLPVRGLAKWDGMRWSEFQGGVDGSIFSLAADKENLYVGGFITRCGSVEVNQIGRWNDYSGWSNMNGGVSEGFNPMVDKIVLDRHLVYVAGRFEKAGGVLAKNLAQWDGSAWSSLSVGLDIEPASIGANNHGLYITGDFPGKIMLWNGQSFETVREYPLRNHANTVFGQGEELYVAISSVESNFLRLDMIARWDGSIWSLLRSF